VRPAGDLPWAAVGDLKVFLTRAGCCVVLRDGRVLMDVGLGFDIPDGRWGQQIRNGFAWGPHQPGAGDTELEVEGTIEEDVAGLPGLHYRERLSLTDKGLRLSYDANALPGREGATAQIVVHLPVRVYADQELSVRPGDARLRLPAEPSPTNPCLVASGDVCLIAAGTEPEVALRGPKNSQWTVFDERVWRLPTYRVSLLPPVQGQAAASPGSPQPTVHLECTISAREADLQDVAPPATPAPQ
jgi:hypothetical protein